MAAAARAAAAASPIARRAALVASPKSPMLRLQPVSAEVEPATLLVALQEIGAPCFDSASVHLEPGFAVVSFSSSDAVRDALRALRGREVLGEKVKAEWVLPPTLTFARLQEAGEAVADSTKAGGLVPLRRSADGNLEALLAVQQRKLAAWEKRSSLSPDVLAILGGRRGGGESVVDCVAREFFEETGGVLGPRGLAKLHAAITDALEVGDSRDCFGAWLAPGKFLVVFAHEALIPPASASGPGRLLEAQRAAAAVRDAGGSASARKPKRGSKASGKGASPSDVAASKATVAAADAPEPASMCSGSVGAASAMTGAGGTACVPEPSPKGEVLPSDGIKEAMDGAPREVKASLGAVFNETSVVQWVSVSDLLAVVQPHRHGPVTYGSPSKLGALYATSVSGTEWRIGHFLTMALMEPVVRRRLEAIQLAPWGARA